MLTGHRPPHWIRSRNAPVQVVVTLLGISCWVGETEIGDKLRIRASWHQRSTCLGTGNDDWEGLTARYCLGWHIPHPDRGSAGQPPATGPRGLNPPSVHLWVNQGMCLSWFPSTFDWGKSAGASDAVGEIPPAPCRELPQVALVMSLDMNTYMGGASHSQGVCWTKPISDQ